ncbi:MAG TPA: M15 family peptidase, partial [Nocardioides sp.]
MGSTSRRRYAAAAALSCALVLAGCGDDTSGATDPSAESPSVSPNASRSPTADGSTSPATDDPSGSDGPLVADPEHAVPPPGPRQGSLVPPDLLVKSREPISEDLVAEIEALPKVENTEQLTLADVGVQNRVISVAAVDPGTYRNYTRIESAELQEQWDRVAGGEVALSDELGTRMVGRDGWLQLGNDEDAPEVHVGATAPQVPQVDAVVNEKWG